MSTNLSARPWEKSGSFATGYDTEGGRRRYGFPFYQYPTNATSGGGVPAGWKLDNVYGWFKVPSPPVQGTNWTRRPTFGSSGKPSCCGGGSAPIVFPNRDTTGDGGDFNGNAYLIGGSGPANFWGGGQPNQYGVDPVRVPSQGAISDTSQWFSFKELVKAVFIGLLVTFLIWFIKAKAV